LSKRKQIVRLWECRRGWENVCSFYLFIIILQRLIMSFCAALAAIEVERKARLQLENVLAEMSKKVRRRSPCKWGERLMCIFVFKTAPDPCAFATTPSTILDGVVAIVILPDGNSIKASYC
jgi:hypothetical protein